MVQLQSTGAAPTSLSGLCNPVTAGMFGRLQAQQSARGTGVPMAFTGTSSFGNSAALSSSPALAGYMSNLRGGARPLAACPRSWAPTPAAMGVRLSAKQATAALRPTPTGSRPTFMPPQPPARPGRWTPRTSTPRPAP